jgi:hypothetical protein
MDVFLHCYNNAFPIKTAYVRDTIKNKWFTHGIKNSSKKMRLLDNQKKTTNMKKKDLEYVERYRTIYRVIQEAKGKECNNCISRAKNKSKAAWQVINKELGKSCIKYKNIELRWGKNKTSNPRVIAELFNSYFECREIGRPKYWNTSSLPYKKLKINTCLQSIFLNPISETEVEKVVKHYRGKCSPGFDDLMDSIIKKCVQFIKKPLADICNALFRSGIFPEILKFAIIKLVHKKGNTEEVRPISL